MNAIVFVLIVCLPRRLGRRAAEHRRVVDGGCTGYCSVAWITLNGLPITSGDDPDVDGWYRANVIGGPGAFLVVANGFAAFAEAIRQKLTLDVAGRAPGRKPAIALIRRQIARPPPD